MKQILPEPKVLLTPSPKLPGTDGRKMSKSYGNTILLSDPEADIRAKLKTMVTDPARVRRTDPGNPDVCPVFDLHKVFSREEVQAQAAEGCTDGGDWLHPVQGMAGGCGGEGAGADPGAAAVLRGESGRSGCDSGRWRVSRERARGGNDAAGVCRSGAFADDELKRSQNGENPADGSLSPRTSRLRRCRSEFAAEARAGGCAGAQARRREGREARGGVAVAVFGDGGAGV